MNNFLRLAAASALAGLALAAPVAAQDFTNSATGNYLAAQEAMDALRTPEAAQFFSAAATDQSGNPQVLNRAFVALAANGDIDRAVVMARQLLQLDPTNDIARLVVATDAMKQRRYDAAIADLDKVGGDSFEGITGGILKAWALTGSGRIDDAFRSLDKLGGGGIDEFLSFHRAIMADVAGRSADAIKYITDAHDGAPLDPDVVEAFARILGNAGQDQPAIDAVVQFEAQGLSNPVISQIKQLLAAKQRPGIYADSVQSGAAIMFHTVGLGFTRDGSNDAALVFLRLAAYLDPRNANVPLAIGQIYDAAGQHDLANAIYDSVPAASPMKPLATLRVADNLGASGDRPEAIKRLQNIVVTNPTDLDAITVLGDMLTADKQYQAAADAYTDALGVTGGKTPGDWRFYYVRGIAYERSDKFPLAEKDFLRALDLNPNQPQVLNYLGYSWVDKGMNLTQALGMVQKAVQLSPNDGFIIDSLGWAYYRLGRYADAVTELEQAAQFQPNDPVINDHLGDAYWQVGRRLEAHFQWNVAYAMDTDGDVKKRVAPKLAGGLDAAPKDGESAPVVLSPVADHKQASPAPAN